MTDEKRIKIKSKEEYDKVQRDLLSKGYKWIDGFSGYYDLFEHSDYDFFNIGILVHHKAKTFEWRF